MGRRAKRAFAGLFLTNAKNASSSRSNIHVHLLGAGVFFAFSLFVVLSQVYLDCVTRESIPHGLGTKLRAGIALVSVGSLVTLAIQGLMILIEFKGSVEQGTPEGVCDRSPRRR